MQTTSMPDTHPVRTDHPQITLDRLFVLCRALGVPLTLDYLPSARGIPEIYIRVGEVGFGVFDGDALELSGQLAEWIGRLERRARERDDG